MPRTLSLSLQPTAYGSGVWVSGSGFQVSMLRVRWGFGVHGGGTVEMYDWLVAHDAVTAVPEVLARPPCSAQERVKSR